MNAAATQVLSRTLRIMGLFGALAALAWPSSGGAAEAAKRYALAHSGFMQLKVPAGWREGVDAQTQPPVISAGKMQVFPRSAVNDETVAH